jgi:3'-phosphoadenosine 5'-phosphosulfate sulfotransferase
MTQQDMIEQTIIKKPKTWVKVESDNFFRFGKPNDTLEGLLIEKQIGDKMIFYKMRTFLGEEKRFHGSKQLDDLLSQFTPPCYLKITLVGESETKNGIMKLFEVEKGEN